MQVPAIVPFTEHMAGVEMKRWQIDVGVAAYYSTLNESAGMGSTIIFYYPRLRSSLFIDYRQVSSCISTQHAILQAFVEKLVGSLK